MKNLKEKLKTLWILVNKFNSEEIKINNFKIKKTGEHYHSRDTYEISYEDQEGKNSFKKFLRKHYANENIKNPNKEIEVLKIENDLYDFIYDKIHFSSFLTRLFYYKFFWKTENLSYKTCYYDGEIKPGDGPSSYQVIDIKHLGLIKELSKKFDSEKQHFEVVKAFEVIFTHGTLIEFGSIKGFFDTEESKNISHEIESYNKENDEKILETLLRELSENINQ